jgi:hypothetical protein
MQSTWRWRSVNNLDPGRRGLQGAHAWEAEGVAAGRRVAAEGPGKIQVWSEC